MTTAAAQAERICAQVWWQALPEGGVRAVRVVVENARPLAVARMLEGRSLGQAMQLLPMLLNVCGQAHVLALHLAARAAREVAPAQPVACGGEMAGMLRAMRLEALREHMLAWLHHVPALLGQDLPQASGVLGALGAAQRDGTAEAARKVAEVVREFMHGAAFAGVLRDVAALALPPVPALGALRRAELPALGVVLLRDTDFALVRLPSAGGEMRHVLKLAEMADRAEELLPAELLVKDLPQTVRWRLGHVARLLQRLSADRDDDRDDAHGTDAAGAANAGDTGMVDDAGMVPLEDDAGLGWVLTARGVLVHVLRLDAEGGVRHCRILAPTEWHCHADGLAARWLRQLRAANADELCTLARGVMLLTDPCEPFVVRVCEAQAAASVMREEVRADA